jgi:Brp/Blh family beta-carotene 15,15'-monooxygenase
MLTQWLVQHTRLAILITAAIAIVAAVAGTVGMPTQLALLAILVAILGLPHGAVDHWQGRALLAPRLGPWWLPVFGTGYIAATGLVIIAWAAWPPLLLTAFLILATAHFGSEDVTARPCLEHRHSLSHLMDIVLRGALPTLLAVMFHPGETAALFAALLPATTAAQVEQALTLATLVSPVYFAALAALIGIALRHGDRLVAAEVAVLAATFAALPPLLAFAVYFCLWHSPRHSLLVIAEAGDARLAAGVRRFVMGALPLTALTVAAAVPAWLALGHSFTSTEATLQIVFIGLAALTVPHVLLPLIARHSGGRTSAPVR